MGTEGRIEIARDRPARPSSNRVAIGDLGVLFWERL